MIVSPRSLSSDWRYISRGWLVLISSDISTLDSNHQDEGLYGKRPFELYLELLFYFYLKLN